jgi:uncharacterized repeat protein (TIGR01451 family)
MGDMLTCPRLSLGLFAAVLLLAKASPAAPQTGPSVPAARATLPVARVSATVPWSGQIQCQLEVKDEGYSSRQTHTWTLTGGPPRGTGDVVVHPAQWSVTGEGTVNLVNGVQATRAQWTVSVPPTDAALNIMIRRDTGALAMNQGGHSQVRVYKAYAGSREVSARGSRGSSTAMDFALVEWQFGTIQQNATDTTFSGSMPVAPPADLMPLAPQNAQRTGTCTWQVGPASATSASVEASPAPSPVRRAGAPAGSIVPAPATTPTTPTEKTGPRNTTVLRSNFPDIALNQRIQNGGTAMTVVNGVATGFLLTAVNRGGAASSAVTVKDTLHPGLVFQASGDPRCTASGATVTCTAPSLVPNASTDFRINVVIANSAAASGTILKITNVATASTSGDPEASNDISNPVTLTVMGPNIPLLFVQNRIWVNGLTEETYAQVGDPVRFHFVLQNISNPATTTAAAPVVIRDQLDSRLSFVPHDIDARTDARCTSSGQLVSCTRATALAVGFTAQDTFDIIVKPTNAAALTPYGSPITNEVTATAANLPEPSGGFGATRIKMLPATITLSLGIVRQDGAVLTTGSVRNNNTMVLRAFPGYNGFNASVPPPVVTDVLGSQFTFVPNSVDSRSDSRCLASGQTVTCTPLDYGLHPYFDLVVRVSDSTAQTQVVHTTNRATASMPGLPSVSKDVAVDILPAGTP